jgi:hypothetical protein
MVPVAGLEAAAARPAAVAHQVAAALVTVDRAAQQRLVTQLLMDIQPQAPAMAVDSAEVVTQAMHTEEPATAGSLALAAMHRQIPMPWRLTLEIQREEEN